MDLSRLLRLSPAIGVVLALLCAPAPANASPVEDDGSAERVDMAEMMARARKLTAPGPHHALLERFIGVWDIELRITMGGGESEPEAGVATFEWLMEGRWITQKSTGSIMGMPTETFGIIGYDNFKMSYVTASVSSIDTALLVSEGDMDPGGKALLSYGTVDEYLTGEHDKMVNYVWRFPSRDKMVFEVHDLPIGESNTKVVEIIYRRRDTDS